MNIQYEPTKSFCYRFARYVLLDEIAKEPEVQPGNSFKMIDVEKPVIERHLRSEQLAAEIPAARADRIDTVYGTLKFYVHHVAKHSADSPFEWLGKGLFQLKSDAELQQEIEEIDLQVEEEDPNVEFDGWIYAFSFPALVKKDAPFPIKIGRTINDVEGRVLYQCKSSASFDQPTILGQWKVKRARSVETAIHSTLKSREKWREKAPGKEWFDTTVSEIDAVVKFVTQQ